jgi:hypothetical protein
MTAQITDTFILHDQEWELIGWQGEGLFDPEQFGMETAILHTACYRGFYATYEIRDAALLLRDLVMREAHGHYVAINGVEPERDDNELCSYHGLAMSVPFTGRLRLARDFIESLYVHMGYQKASAYSSVVDTRFEAGRLVELRDRSVDAAAVRSSLERGQRPADMIEFIVDAFDSDSQLEW